MQQQQFMGLTMPVFTAFGWAGEEQAVNYALSQVEQFINELHVALPRRMQTHLPFYGLNPDSQIAYLSAAQEPESDVYVAFIVRPMSLEMQLSITDQMALGKALRATDADPERWLNLLQALPGEWILHVKQMEVNEETDERTSYQDLYKDPVDELDLEATQSLTSRAHFLNGEPQWVTPLFLSRRFQAEQVAAMGVEIVRVMAERVSELETMFEFLTGRDARPKKKKATTKPKAKRAPRKPETLDPDKQFVYVTKLKPLHIRRGFVNLTPEHWEFFASSARATTRSITVNFEDNVDNDSSVWRLSSNDMARIVLSETVQVWLEDNFDADDRVQVTATKKEGDEIEVLLEPVE